MEKKKCKKSQVYNYISNLTNRDQLSDNTPASVILYKARTNNLNINDRTRCQNEDTSCIVCGAAEDSLEHLLLHCSGYGSQRAAVPALQQPFPEQCNAISPWDISSLPTRNITNMCSTKCGRRGRRRKTNNNKDTLEENTA